MKIHILVLSILFSGFVSFSQNYVFINNVTSNFNNPLGIALDKQGNIYVVDQGNKNIQKLSATGTFISQWGTYGTGSGQFQSPTSIAVDKVGNVYVSDYYNRIQKFTSSGTFITQWGSTGSGNGNFNVPSGMTFDAVGNILIADIGNNRVQKFTSSGTYISQFPIESGWIQSLDGYYNPTGMVTDASDNIYVVLSKKNRVFKYNSAGLKLQEWGASTGGSDPGLYFPYGIAIDVSGNLFVVDSGNNRIRKFNSSGVFLTGWGSQGTSNGQFNNPTEAAVDSLGNVFVVDRPNKRISRYAPCIVPSAVIAYSASVICTGSSVSFTATGMNSGTSPSFNWLVDDVFKGSGSTFSYLPSSGQKITAILTVGGILPSCLANTTATSNSLTLTVNSFQSPSLSIIANTSTVCQGEDITFSASGTNLGSTSVYKWIVNGIQKSFSNTYSYSPNSADKIFCIATASGLYPACLSAFTATSSSIIPNVLPFQSESIMILALTSTVCNGNLAVVSVIGGNISANKIYSWQLNGINQNTFGGLNFGYIPTNNDLIIVNSKKSDPINGVCTTGTSSGITISTVPYQINTLDIVASTLTVCSGNSVIFSVTGSNLYPNSSFSWFVNGNNQSTTSGPSFVYAPSNGQQISASAKTNLPYNYNCYISNTSAIGINVFGTPTSLSISSPTGTRCDGNIVTLTAFGYNYGISPNYKFSIFRYNPTASSYDCALNNAECVKNDMDSLSVYSFKLASGTQFKVFVLLTNNLPGQGKLCSSNNYTAGSSVTIGLSNSTSNYCILSQITSISGLSQLYSSQNSTYFVNTISGVLYTWSVTGGATITNGQGSNISTVQFGTTGGTIFLTAKLGTNLKTISLPFSVGTITASKSEISKDRLTVYPNPFNDFVKVESINDFEYQIYNSSGIIVEYGNQNTNKIGYNLKSGLYFIRVSGILDSKITKVLKD